MQTLIHADIFFFITTIWVIVISALVVYILFNVAGIIRDAKYISKKIREGGDVLSEDLGELRTAIRTKGQTANYIFKYFEHLFSKRQNHKK